MLYMMKIFTSLLLQRDDHYNCPYAYISCPFVPRLCKPFFQQHIHESFWKFLRQHCIGLYLILQCLRLCLWVSSAHNWKLYCPCWLGKIESYNSLSSYKILDLPFFFSLSFMEPKTEQSSSFGNIATTQGKNIVEMFTFSHSIAFSAARAFS